MAQNLRRCEQERIQLLTEAEVAQMIGTSKSWLQRRRVEGGGILYLKLGKTVRYRIDSVEVYGLGEAGLFDEFFYFLDYFGFKDLFMGLDPKTKKRRSPIPYTRIIFVYLMHTIRYQDTIIR